MEVAVDDRIPTFSGGLGVLAGDFLRAAADAGLPVLGVTLLYRSGYFRQALSAEDQVELAVQWDPAAVLEPLEPRVTIRLFARPVAVGAWRLLLAGDRGEVPVYYLDTDLAENDARDRAITGQLYTGDRSLRLAQEAVLGLAGPALLGAIGHQDVRVYHLNEGHAALVPVALAGRLGPGTGPQADAASDSPPTGPAAARAPLVRPVHPEPIPPEALAAVRERCVFTTHTPEPAGNERFSLDTVTAVLGAQGCRSLEGLGCIESGTLDMTALGMSASRAITAVSRRHRQVTQALFPSVAVGSVTNGVHAATWASPSTRRLLDRHIDGWRSDNTLLRYASSIPLDEVAAAHREAKAQLCEHVAARTATRLDPGVLTIAVARRATAYKRNDLVLTDPARLGRIGRAVGPLQIVFAGKAHPDDAAGKAMISQILRAVATLGPPSAALYLPDYGLGDARVLCAGVDVWLNTPIPPREASCTSGMKAAINGVPSLSTLDGWWCEGHLEAVTGWAIDADGDSAAAALYDVLEGTVVPTYYEDPQRFTWIGRQAMALNGSFFNAQRMLAEYVATVYRLDPTEQSA